MELSLIQWNLMVYFAGNDIQVVYTVPSTDEILLTGQDLSILAAPEHYEYWTCLSHQVTYAVPYHRP